MEDIKCPRCNRKTKLEECVCKDKGRKRVMISFPCYHYPPLVYNVPLSMDNNTIIKSFKTISEEHFNRKPSPWSGVRRDIYLD